MAGENSAASMAQASQPVKLDTISLPGFGTSKNFVFDPSKYRVRYTKLDMDDLGSLAELEIIETKGLKGEEIVVLNKTGWSFLDKYFMIITYLEHIVST